MTCNVDPVMALQIPDPRLVISQFVNSGKTLRILVSEDELINQKYLETMVRKIGFACDCARDGRETFERMREHRYDVVLLDMQMPVMNGEEVIAALKRENLLGDAFIIAQTAYAMKGDEEKYLSLGCHAYMSKPIALSTLEHALAEAIIRPS
jgi:CheY-like chemotaxis protein